MNHRSPKRKKNIDRERKKKVPLLFSNQNLAKMGINGHKK